MPLRNHMKKGIIAALSFRVINDCIAEENRTFRLKSSGASVSFCQT